MSYTSKALMTAALALVLWHWYQKRTPWIVTVLESRWKGDTAVVRNVCYGIATLLILAMLFTACSDSAHSTQWPQPWSH
jgi:hypothetical protein